MARNTDPFASDFAEHTPPTLHPLRMEGSGEAPEGLLSWVVGSAQAHCVGPRTLVKHLVDQSAVHSDLWSDAAFFERHCGTVNGLGRYARMMLELLGKASFPAAQGMTLLGLSHLLPTNGEGLLVRCPQWCYACLCDQVRLGQRPHYPLVWSFEHYRICHHHGLRMSSQCPACGATQPFLPFYPSLLHCAHCGKSLITDVAGTDAVPDESPTEFERWCAHKLADLIAQREELHARGGLSVFRENLEWLAAQTNPAGRKSLCLRAGLQPRAINGWLNKGERPSVYLLLRLCFGLGLQPVDLLLPHLRHWKGDAGMIATSATERQPRPILGLDQVSRMQRLLETILADPNDHRHLQAIATQLGLTRHALKYWFPQQARAIVAKNRACEDRKQLARRQRDHDVLHCVLQQLHADGTYPSRRRVNALLGPHKLSLVRPDLLQAYQAIGRRQ